MTVQTRVFGVMVGLVVALAASVGWTAEAEERDGERRRPPGRGERPEGGRRQPPPLIVALDADKDGEISAEEIANAATALKTLDKNGDGKLTRDEIRPQDAQRGGRRRRPGGGEGEGEGEGDGPKRRGPGGGKGGHRGGEGGGEQ